MTFRFTDENTDGSQTAASGGTDVAMEELTLTAEGFEFVEMEAKSFDEVIISFRQDSGDAHLYYYDGGDGPEDAFFVTTDATTTTQTDLDFI